MHWSYIANGNTLRLDASRCSGCGICIEVCPHAVFSFRAEQSGRPPKVEIADRRACMECGACATNCAFGALTVKAGVGCAQAVLNGLRSGTDPDCGCGCGGDEACC